MLEFVFFNAQTCGQFVDFLGNLGVGADLVDDDETFGVAIDEGLDEALLDKIELRYDELMVLDQSLFEQQADADGEHTAGVVLNLASGDTVYAQVDPFLLGRIMEVLTPEEFGSVVNAIVDAVEKPDRRPLCKR
jgi:hypothetical protein